MTVTPTRAAARLAAALLFSGAIAGVLPAGPAHAAQPLTAAFDRAAEQYDLPRDLLVALGYAETRLDGHGGLPSAANGYGLMHLVSNPTHHTLDEAAKLTGLSVERLRTDPAANITGAAAVLRSYAGTSTAVDDLYGAVARYGGAADPTTARLYADAVYDYLAAGIPGLVMPRAVQPSRGALDDVAPIGTLSTDYPPARWVAANPGNYTVANRETSHNIQYVVIHTTQGSYAGTISWIQNPVSEVSAHYVIRSSDGEVTQMVRDKDIGWHAGNWTINTQSIGIEHEGFVDNPAWYTDAMYRSSAALTRFMCDKYGIPKDRAHIIAHSEVPGATHTDPGPNWNWTRYMDLVRGTTAWSQTVDNSTAGRFTASGNWGTSTYFSTRYGPDYRYAEPLLASDAAWYRFNIPATATYRVEVWYPAAPGYNTKAPYIVVTPSGNRTVFVDQRAGGGRWNSIGTFTLAAGDGDRVAVSRWTDGTGLVIADAIRVTRV